jgi:hypothetical protein
VTFLLYWATVGFNPNSFFFCKPCFIPFSYSENKFFSWCSKLDASQNFIKITQKDWMWQVGIERERAFRVCIVMNRPHSHIH